MHEQVMSMIEKLEAPGNRLRTGLLLIPPKQLEKVGDIAARLLADVEDIAQTALVSVPAGSCFVNLNASRVEQWLNEISEKPIGQIRALVVNLDLLLAGIDEGEHVEVWHYIRNSMPYRRRVLIVAMPETAEHLLPNVEEWKMGGRCAQWE